MEKITTSLDQHGRMLIPASIRVKFNIVPGDKVTLEVTKDSLTIKNADSLVNEMHSIFTKSKPIKKHSAVDDFIKNKREDFKIEKDREIKHD